MQDFIEVAPTSTRTCSSWNKKGKKHDASDKGPRDKDEGYEDFWHQELTNTEKTKTEKRWQDKMNAMKRKIELKMMLDENPFDALFPTAKYATPLWGSFRDFRRRSIGGPDEPPDGSDPTRVWVLRKDHGVGNLQHHSSFMRSSDGLRPNPIEITSCKTQDESVKEKDQGPSNSTIEQVHGGIRGSMTSEQTTESKASRSLKKDATQNSSTHAGEQGSVKTESMNPFKPKIESTKANIEYAYDPITNRMVPKSAPSPADFQNLETSRSREAVRTTFKKSKDTQKESNESVQILSETDSGHKIPMKPAGLEIESQPKVVEKVVSDQSTAWTEQNGSTASLRESPYLLGSILSNHGGLVTGMLEEFVGEWWPFIDAAIREKRSPLLRLKERKEIESRLTELRLEMLVTYGATPNLDRLIGVLEDTGFFDPEPKHLRQAVVELKGFFESIKRKQHKIQYRKRNGAEAKKEVDMLLPEDVRAAMGNKKTERSKAESTTVHPMEQVKSPPVSEATTTSSQVPTCSAPLGPIWRRDKNVHRVQLEAPLESSVSRMAGGKQSEQTKNGFRLESSVERMTASKPQVLRCVHDIPHDADSADMVTVTLEKLQAHEQERQRLKRKRELQRLKVEPWYSTPSFSGLNKGEDKTSKVTPTRQHLAATRQLSNEVEAMKTAMQTHESACHSLEPNDGSQSNLRGRGYRQGKDICMQQAEGDMSEDVVKFAEYERWYKKPAPHALAAEEKKRAQMEAHRVLTRELRHIYESHYGTIDEHHRQPSLPASSSSSKLAATQASTSDEAPFSVQESDRSSKSPSASTGELSSAESSTPPLNPTASSDVNPTKDSPSHSSVENLFGEPLLKLKQEIVKKGLAREPHSLKPFTHEEVDTLSLRHDGRERLLKRQKDKVQKGLAKEPHSLKPFEGEEIDVLNTKIPPSSSDHPDRTELSSDVPDSTKPSSDLADNTEPSPDLMKKPEINRLLKQHEKIDQKGLAKESHSNKSSTSEEPEILNQTISPSSSSLSDGTDLQSPSSEPARVTESSAFSMAVFKIIYSDPWTFSTEVETVSNSSTSTAATEHAMRLSEALSTLEAPLKFLPRIRRYMNAGYEPVGVTKDMVILRKIVDRSSSSSSSSSAAADDADDIDEVSSESTSPTTTINPIDGTCAPQNSPPTGNFASPTGFVNYNETYREDDRDSTPRVRREERVFSGGQPKGKRGEGRRRVFWTALLTASGCYVVGWLAEIMQ